MLFGEKNDNARETQHQVVENLDNLREVILERQKSRLLNKLMNTFTEYYVHCHPNQVV